VNVDARDPTHLSTPLGWAAFGSVHRRARRLRGRRGSARRGRRRHQRTWKPGEHVATRHGRREWRCARGAATARRS
jgi:hypothetical protein